MKTYPFINLSNGIEALEKYDLDFDQCRFLRIQSTACEQKRWGPILDDLSPDFLMLAALGKPIVVYDFGANKEIPRAIWQGLEWVKCVLCRRWHFFDYHPIGRASSMAEYFAHQYHNLGRRTKSKLDYYGKFCTGNILDIRSSAGATAHDGDIEYQRRVIYEASEREE